MNKIKFNLEIWIVIVSILGIWFALLFFNNTPLSFSYEALSKIGNSIAIFGAGYIIFRKWLWKWPLINLIVKYPDLSGTWEGSLQTNWKNPETGEVPGPIPMALVIKQTFDSISCVMYTQESTSFSNAAMLYEDDGSGVQRLSYNYMNTPDTTLRGRSAIHYGAAVLRIINENSKYKLTGEYWTSRNTAGSISLAKKSSRIINSFPEHLIPKKTKEIKK